MTQPWFCRPISNHNLTASQNAFHLFWKVKLILHTHNGKLKAQIHKAVFYTEVFTKLTNIWCFSSLESPPVGWWSNCCPVNPCNRNSRGIWHIVALLSCWKDRAHNCTVRCVFIHAVNSQGEVCDRVAWRSIAEQNIRAKNVIDFFLNSVVSSLLVDTSFPMAPQTSKQ